MIKFNLTNPISVGTSAVTSLVTWSTLGFPMDLKHLSVVATTALGGLAVPHQPSSSPSVQAESHIVTPYVNNIESS